MFILFHNTWNTFSMPYNVVLHLNFGFLFPNMDVPFVQRRCQAQLVLLSFNTVVSPLRSDGSTSSCRKWSQRRLSIILHYLCRCVWTVRSLSLGLHVGRQMLSFISSLGAVFCFPLTGFDVSVCGWFSSSLSSWVSVTFNFCVVLSKSICSWFQLSGLYFNANVTPSFKLW